MSHKLAVAVPRLASTILLLTQAPQPAVSRNPTGGAEGNDIHVLMMKRHSKARFMPNIYVFPGGGVDVADYVISRNYLATYYDVHTPPTAELSKSLHSFIEAKASSSPAESETEAWACRVGALRELAEEAACVLQRDATIRTADEWKERSTTAGAAVPPTMCDIDAAPLLRPVGRWVTPRHFMYRYDTYFYAALVRGAAVASQTTFAAAQELPLIAQTSEVEDLLWVSPLEALRRHENESDSFSLAPPTFLLLHALARQPSYAALAETWAKTLPSSSATAPTATEVGRVGTLPYSSVLPCIEPRSRLTQDGKHIKDFILPKDYFYEKGWSEPEGAYGFCGEAFDNQTHKVRMWVGSHWVQKVEDGSVDLSKAAARQLTH
ncbi:hypothetical protein ABL78_5996 [Leptomonas seymouri]|uniref:Nudix hydrolase domain-containing protein n=1 Tax=Leptomonas seymouri TaxID=5684 RepID=A0A0N1IIQ0_LEPSE|nr:hypothetical protein ABL78_5996 [Leptomonas seymouri]|eukprot:KPI84953.1 hypothetical protein ABL78_5996 [Leptomonas seymouri]